ncbi:hypothetical protein BCR35DRAFT_328529 [Leucosporidium creatinivorum]|uniref:Uncharacterized protein n=1 Tax=Leucosporidium creatinivorum TaxID=106004 RepID=A0A1Y2G1J1_9BASI|nr:hypothetical protein BCR35DRAFT_328529 [Leucosporidium creatinivorum]
MPRPNTARTRAVDAAAHRLLDSGALDGWLSPPASTTGASRPSSRATSSRGGSLIPATSRPPTHSPSPSARARPHTATSVEEKSPSAFYEHGAFQIVQDPQERAGRGHAEASSSLEPPPNPAATPRPPSLAASEDFQSAPAYGDDRLDFVDPSAAAPSLAPQRSRLRLFRGSSAPATPPEAISHEHLAMRIRRLPEIFHNRGLALRGAGLRPFDVDKPNVDTQGVRQERPSNTGIQEVVARGDGIWMNIAPSNPGGSRGPRVALHMLPDRVALSTRRWSNRGNPQTIKVPITELVDTSGNKPFKNHPNDEWTFVSRVGYQRRSAQPRKFPISTREIQTKWLLRGAGLPPQGMMVLFVFRTPFEPHSRPGANDQAEIPVQRHEHLSRMEQDFERGLKTGKERDLRPLLERIRWMVLSIDVSSDHHEIPGHDRLWEGRFARLTRKRGYPCIEIFNAEIIYEKMVDGAAYPWLTLPRLSKPDGSELTHKVNLSNHPHYHHLRMPEDHWAFLGERISPETQKANRTSWQLQAGPGVTRLVRVDFYHLRK